MAAPLMTPAPEAVARSQMAAFMRQAGCSDYDALHAWSIRERAAFWKHVWDYCGVLASAPATDALVEAGDFHSAQWFPGARLNFAENLLRRRDGATAHRRGRRGRRTAAR